MKRKPDPKPPGRNEPCSCGSGKKYKKCCLLLEMPTAASHALWDENERIAKIEREKKRAEMDRRVAEDRKRRAPAVTAMILGAAMANIIPPERP